MVVITFVTPVITFVIFFGVCFFDDLIPKKKHTKSCKQVKETTVRRFNLNKKRAHSTVYFKHGSFVCFQDKLLPKVQEALLHNLKIRLQPKQTHCSNVFVTYLKQMSLFSHPAVFTENRLRFL